jgi:beta-galactosidase
VIDSTVDFSQLQSTFGAMLYMLRPGRGRAHHRFVEAGGTFIATYMTRIT